MKTVFLTARIQVSEGANPDIRAKEVLSREIIEAVKESELIVYINSTFAVSGIDNMGAS